MLAERHQLRGERARALGRPENLRERVVDCARLLFGDLSELHARHDDGEHVVEIVRDAACQTAQRVEALGFSKPVL